MIYKIRVILDSADDVLRDLEIPATSTLEDFHNIIHQSFQLQGDEMASFYETDDDWNQGQEYCLFDMSGGMEPVKKMEDTTIDQALSKQKPNLIYIYDFLSMWTFMITLVDIDQAEDGEQYPRVLFAMGELPDEAPDRNFEADPRFDNDLDDDDLNDDDDYYDEESFDDYELY